MSVDLSVENGLAEIVLNRPDKMNALNDAMVAELNVALERAASQGVRAMMIRGEGPASRRAATSRTHIRATRTPKR